MNWKRSVLVCFMMAICLVPATVAPAQSENSLSPGRTLPSYPWNGKITCNPPSDMKLLYFRDNTDIPLTPADYRMEDELIRIYQAVLQCYYSEFLIFDANNLPPRTEDGHSFVDVLKVYDFSFRDDLLVLANEEMRGRPRCYPFYWKDGTLFHFNVDERSVDGDLSVRAFKLIYHAGFPGILAETADFSNRGNGWIDICRIVGSSTQHLIRCPLGGNDMMNLDRRDYPGMERIPADAAFSCGYARLSETGLPKHDALADWRLPVFRYVDWDHDGATDIRMLGRYECSSGGESYFSESEELIFLQDPHTGAFRYSEKLSVLSPLHEYWSGGNCWYERYR